MAGNGEPGGVAGRPATATAARVAARWGGTRLDPHGQARRARAEPLQAEARTGLREVLEAVMLTREVRGVVEVGGTEVGGTEAGVVGGRDLAGAAVRVGQGGAAGGYRELGATTVHRVGSGPDAAPGVVPVESLVEAPVADLYVLDGPTDHTSVLDALTVVLAAAPDAVVLVHDVLWPTGRRDRYPAGAAAARSTGHEGALVRHDGVSPAGIVGAFATAVEAGGQRNGVLTAVEDAIAGAPEPWSLAIVPALSGLAVLARDGAPFAEELWEALLPWTNSELLALLERNRIALYSQVQELRHGAALAAAETEDLRSRLRSCSRRLDAAWDEVAEQRATIARYETTIEQQQARLDEPANPLAAVLARALHRHTPRP
ncbi:hypothetical protein GCM10009836_11680 [Pseudonocardia ailaonensis]|uniref:Uncharacterized protein n=1 Tax=Pseudonocardia ailaonensis TaxID=367279 RepID=A0ABN2MQF1_9PSEU